MNRLSTQSLIYILVFLILFSGLFSAIETAYSSASKIRLRAMDNSNVNGAGKVLRILDNFDKFLSTVLIGNNIVNIMAATIGTLIFTRFYGDDGPTISTIFITLIVLFIGEITPKSIAKQMPEHFAIKTADFVSAVQLLFTPLSIICHGWTFCVNKLVPIREDDSDIADELITMVDEAEKEGDLEQHESDLISAAIEFNDLDVRDVLTPRVEVVAISLTTPIREIEKVFRFNSFSRLPVYENSIDNIVGVIHEKDFYSMMATDGDKGVLKRIIKPIIYTSENVKISSLLKQLQKAKLHLAVVLDEYGGTAGIITLEDIIEELVGEIWDEHDTVKEFYEQLDENTWLVKCDADVDEMFERFNVEVEEDEFDFITVSGWVIHEFERIPVAGESFVYKNLSVEVTQADRRKVIEVKVNIKEDESDDSDD